jgi:cephalosporin hydroxylase
MATTISHTRRLSLLRAIGRIRNSIAKRLLWRIHLAEAKARIELYKRELTTLEMLMAVPVMFRGKGFYRSLELKQNMDELLGLARVLQQVELNTVCEIGTFKGGTLFLWCQLAADDADVFSIDLPRGEFGGGCNERCLPFFDAFRKPGQRLDCIRGDSHSREIREQFTSKLAGRELDFLFIDGDHSYAGVGQDYEEYAPMVRSGGIIAFHDILPRADQPDIEVWRFWGEIKHHHRHREFIESGDQRRRIGIGLVYKE